MGFFPLGLHGFRDHGEKRSNSQGKETEGGECGILENEQQPKLCARGHWRPAEDAKLKELVSQYGPQNWNLIAEKLVGRSGKSCRLRWFNQLDPRINRKAFSEEEEERLLAAHRLYGNKWALIARLFPGRTDNAVKNHWHVIMARKQREQSNAYRRRKPSLPSYNSPSCQHLHMRMEASTSNKANSGESTISSTKDESASTATDLSLNSFTSRILPGFFHLCSPSHQQHSVDILNVSHENVVTARNGFHDKFGDPGGNFSPVMLDQSGFADSTSELASANDPVAYLMNHALPHGETNYARENTMLPFFDFLGVGAR
ncbi:hypothetical protein Cni_G25141 [Canna indica]|uniref:Uncharacterized protein n=1 Tax=Canna indica TaxID=4628 RepID=A0AAQ3KX55_9LILI|nr:hypothetical protein Cni_G25141 [Canna indica]